MKNKNRVFLFLLIVAALSTACPSGVDPVNPYDPDTPTANKAKASLSGQVLLEGDGDVTQVEILVAGLTGHPNEDGTFLVEGIPPTIQEVLFRLEGYEDVRQSRLFTPGSTEEMNVRIQVLRGSVTGSVLLQEQNDHSGVTVVLVPVNDTEGSFQMAALTATQGNYVFDSVPVGTYRLSASKPHYMGKVVNDVKVDPYSISQVPQLELPPVTGAVEILGGDPAQDDPFVNPDYPACCPNDRFTRTAQVLLHTEGFNAVRMKVSEDKSSLQGSEGWETYQTEQTFELSELNGAKTVYVLLEDNNGVRSDVLEGHTILDTQAPQVIDLMLGDGSGYTAESAITVSAFADDLPAESGIAEMRMEVQNAPAEDSVWQPYLLRAPFVLPQEDGEHQVFVELRDRAGNRAQLVSGSIRLDRQPPHPQEGQDPVVVHNGSGYALGMDVPIYLNVTDDITPPEDMKMAVCETEGCAGVAFSPFSSQTIMSFSSEGAHTVYAVFKDGAGNVYSPEGVNFEIDTTPPTFPVVSVEEGDSVSSSDIHLLIDLSGADQVLVSQSAEVPAPDDPRWTAFQNRLAYDLGQTEGEHMIFVYARDLAGHMTGPAMVSVDLDTKPPEGNIHIITNQSNCNGIQCYTNSESILVEVDVTSADDTSSIQMRLSLDDTFDEPLQSYAPVATMLLANDQSIFQEVHAQLIDQAGNTTQIVSDNSIRLDLDPPSLPMISTTPSGYTSSHQGINLSIDTDSDDDVSGVEHYEYLVDPLPSTWGSLTWKIFNGNEETLDVDGCDSCSYTFLVRAIDYAGNIGDPASVHLVVDETAPETPNASVVATGIDKGPKVINADAVSVWVQTADSSDENFDQFQVRLRTCSGSYDPGTDSCNNGNWSSWSSWRDTGVGKGGREILVVLAAQNAANKIQVRGRDMTGATSPEDSVIFTEDSRPPSPPVIYPKIAEVNADTAILYISDLAIDENSIDSYECTINGKFECRFWAYDPNHNPPGYWSDNGGNSSHLPKDTREIKVNLNQDSENIVRLRAIDSAGNYSGTFESSVTEKSTIIDFPKELSARSANRFVNTSYNFTVTNPDSMDMDGSLIATSFYGRMDDNSGMGGLLIQDLNSNRNIVFSSNTNDVHVEHQQIVATVSLFNLCNGDFGPPEQMHSTGNKEFPRLCNCIKDNNSSDCSTFSIDVQALLSDHRDDVGIPVLIDMSTTEPIIQVIHTDFSTGLGLQTPLLREANYIHTLTSFDGMRFAWLGPPSYPDTVFVSKMENDSGGLCDPSLEFCVFTLLGAKSFSNSGKSGRVAVTDKVVAWTYIDRAQISHIMVYDYVNGLDPWEIDPDGAKFDRDLRNPMVADCRWDTTTNSPLCRYLFWVSQSTLSPTVKVMDLEDPSSLIMHNLRTGIVEIHSMGAEDGKVAWLDIIDGTNDVFFLDLDDQCGYDNAGTWSCEPAKIIVRSNDEESMLALSGPLVPYWRLAGDGLQMHVSEAASRPWFLARPGVHAMTKTDNDKVALSYIDPVAPSNPYNIGTLNAATHELSWKDEGNSMRLPIAIRDMGSDEAFSFLTINDNGNFETRYFDSSLGSSISLHKTAAQMGINDATGTFVTTYATGDRNRTIWVEQEIHSNGSKGYTAILDCDMDQFGLQPCRLGGFRLLYKIPQIWNENPSVCSIATDGDMGVLVLMQENDNGPHPSSGYRLDMAALDSYVDSHNVPIVPTSIHTLATDFPSIHSELFGGSDTDTRYDQNQCSDFMNNRVAIDSSSQSSTIAIMVSSNVCTRCAQDNDTSYFNETCDDPPCCGSDECDCASPNGNSCDDTSIENRNRLMVFDNNSDYRNVAMQITDESSTALELLDDFLVSETRKDGRWVFLVQDLKSGSTWKLFKDNKDVMFPNLYEKNGATHLMWSDATMGPLQIFDTVLSH